MDEFLKKMVLAKEIMNRHDDMVRGNNHVANPKKESVSEDYDNNDLIENYNIKEDSTEKINRAKLPDEIKQLMLERPIREARPINSLSGNDFKKIGAEIKKREGFIQKERKDDEETSLNIKLMKKMIREAMEEVLYENDLLVETTKKTKETIQFKIGKNIFEGQITKVKQLK